MTRRWTLCHTADWHLGHALHGRSRDPEHAAFCEWLIELCASPGAGGHAIDALVIAGDVFDSASPPGSAQAIFYRFLAELHRRAPAIEVIVVAGNHDSPARLSAPDPVLRAMGVRIVGTPRWIGDRLDAASLVLPIRARGEIVARVAALPYLRASDLPPIDELDPAARIVCATRAVFDAVAEALRSERDRRESFIVTGHCCVAGAALSEASERAIVGGLAGTLPLDVFPADADYVALGHLHLAQAVSASHVRYSGSPIPLALGEAGYPHEVRVVTFEEGRVIDQQGVRVPRSVEIVRLPEVAQPLEEVERAIAALELEGSLPEARWPWLEARVRLDRPEPALRARIDAAIAGRPVRLVKITAEHPPRLGDRRAAPRSDLADLDVRDVFLRRWRRERDGDPPPDVQAAFDEILAQVLAGAESAGEREAR